MNQTSSSDDHWSILQLCPAVLYAVEQYFSKQRTKEHEYFRPMCGRITLATPTAKLIELFQLTSFPRLEPRFNIAPTQITVCVRGHRDAPEAAELRWGLVPPWAKELSVGSRMINARSETAAEKPSFRNAFRKKRCLIPVDGFYEWEKIGPREKQPWLIHAAERNVFALAGLWESWSFPKADLGDAASPPVETCTILTTAANADMELIHDRMPVIIPPNQFNTWLDGSTGFETLHALMQPSPEGFLQRYRVSTLVNKVSFDHADCTLPCDVKGQGTLF